MFNFRSSMVVLSLALPFYVQAVDQSLLDRLSDYHKLERTEWERLKENEEEQEKSSELKEEFTPEEIQSPKAPEVEIEEIKEPEQIQEVKEMKKEEILPLEPKQSLEEVDDQDFDWHNIPSEEYSGDFEEFAPEEDTSIPELVPEKETSIPELETPEKKNPSDSIPEEFEAPLDTIPEPENFLQDSTPLEVKSMPSEVKNIPEEVESEVPQLEEPVLQEEIPQEELPHIKDLFEQTRADDLLSQIYMTSEELDAAYHSGDLSTLVELSFKMREELNNFHSIVRVVERQYPDLGNSISEVQSHLGNMVGYAQREDKNNLDSEYALYDDAWTSLIEDIESLVQVDIIDKDEGLLETWVDWLWNWWKKSE